ncbi:MAG: sigma-70 family RNA polymerase sigma factor [Bacteroidota bacterium]
MFSKIDDIRKALLAGDNSCLQQVFDQCGNYCIKTLKDKYKCSKEDAEDIFIDSIIIFRENVLNNKLQVITSLKGYLLGICVNKYKEQLFKENRQLKHLDEIVQNWYPEEYEEDDSLKIINNKAFSKLSIHCQTILKYFYVEKISMAEIADHLNLANANSVKVTKARCYKKWKDLVEKLKSN